MSTRPFRMGEVVMIEGMATEQFEVVGINEPEKTLLLHGDWSQYGYPPGIGMASDGQYLSHQTSS